MTNLYILESRGGKPPLILVARFARTNVADYVRETPEGVIGDELHEFNILSFLVSGLVNSQYSIGAENGEKDAYCFQGVDASKEIKSWVKTVVEEETENYSIEFFDISLSVVQNGEGNTWHIVSDGLQGAFYFEKSDILEDESEAEEPAVYLYPDYSTAIVGVWRNHLLVSGRTTNLVEACRSGDAWTLNFGEKEGPTMTYSPPSHNSLGVHTLQRDPYEEKTIEVLRSLLPGGNDGLFAKKDIETG